MGCALLKLGRREEALARFDQAPRLVPTIFVAHFYRALTLELLDQSEAAVAAMRRARAVDTEPWDQAWAVRGRAFVQSWWRGHPELPVLLAAVQKLSNAMD